MIPSLVIGLSLAAYFGVPWLYMRWLRKRARARCRKTGEVILTFDDGPSDQLTERILACLDKYDVRAAHFVTTSNLASREGKIQRQVTRGDVVGCHGFGHVHHWKSWPWSGVLDIRAGWARLHKITGEKTTLVPFRPPYGKLNLVSLIFLLMHRTPIAVWTLDSGDTAQELQETPQQVVDRIRGEGGGIVLLHDYDRDDSRVNDFVIETVEALLREPMDGIRVVSPTHDTFR